MDLNIKTKILLLTLGVSIISLAVFLFVASTGMEEQGDYALSRTIKLGEEAAQQSKIALEEQTEDQLIKLVISQAYSSNDFFKKIEEQVLAMSNFYALAWENQDSNLREFKESDLSYLRRIAPGVSEQEVRAEFNVLKQMGPLFEPQLEKNDNLESIFLGTESGLNLIWPHTGGESSGEYDPRQRPWYKDAVKARGISWTDPFTAASTDKTLVASSNPVFGADGEVKGVVGATITIDGILNVIGNELEDVDDKIEQRGYALLIDNNGEIIASPGLNQKNRQDGELKDVAQNRIFKGLVDKMLAGEHGLSRIGFWDEQWFVGYAPIEAPGWGLAVLISADKATAAAEDTENTIKSAVQKVQTNLNQLILNVQKDIILIFIALIIVVLLLSNWLAERLNQPLKKLGEEAAKIGQGELEREIEIETGDEIEELANNFNKMTDDLKNYIQELKETTAAKEKIESELEIATKIQASMLPRTFPAFPDREEFDVYASMKPAKEVGGDFYDFFMIDEERFGFVIGDVSGKGVPAALFMVIAKTLIKNEALRGLSAEKIFTNANNALCKDNEELLFVTSFIGILNFKEEKIEYANAGHNPALLYRAETGEAEYLEAEHGFVLGGMEGFEYTREEVEFRPGDVIYIYTDGVTEAMDKSDEQYSEERLMEAFSQIEEMEVENIEEEVKASVEEFVGEAPQYDDLTMLAAKFKKQ
ncbi:MAG: SpoIIE family protein phosphatase [Halanaerobacter sp.]